jgi:hypothetical protein
LPESDNSCLEQLRLSNCSCTGRSRVSTLQRAIHQELNSCYSDVVIRCRGYSNCRLSRDSRAISGTTDRYGRRNVISGRGEANPVNRSAATCEVIQEAIC